MKIIRTASNKKLAERNVKCRSCETPNSIDKIRCTECNSILNNPYTSEENKIERAKENAERNQYGKEASHKKTALEFDTHQDANGIERPLPPDVGGYNYEVDTKLRGLGEQISQDKFEKNRAEQLGRELYHSMIELIEDGREFTLEGAKKQAILEYGLELHDDDAYPGMGNEDPRGLPDVDKASEMAMKALKMRFPDLPLHEEMPQEEIDWQSQSDYEAERTPPNVAPNRDNTEPQDLY